MTSLPEKLMAIIAPHVCIMCSNYNNVLCDECIFMLPAANSDSCFACDAPCSASNICSSCQRQSKIQQAFIGASYEGAVAEAIKKLKFGRAKAAAEPLAKILINCLPVLPEQTVIVPIPTTPLRARQRGYDQAALIAKYVGKYSSLPVVNALGREFSARQLGANRMLRAKQMQNAFYCKNTNKICGKTILLIDDVATTGATLKSAAKTLYNSGADKIYVATVAKTPAVSVN